MQGRSDCLNTLASAQEQEPEVQRFVIFLKSWELPDDDVIARKMALQQSLFTLQDSVLYHVDPNKRSNRLHAVVTQSPNTRSQYSNRHVPAPSELIFQDRECSMSLHLAGGGSTCSEM